MLTAEEEATIRAEEMFRLGVRRDLEASNPRPTRRERVWVVLNSSFALWFLSSIILAGFTAGFTSYRAWQEERENRANLEKRLDVEISNRIAQALAGVRIDKVRLEHGEAYLPHSYYMTVDQYLNNTFLLDPHNRKDFSLYPEFRTRGFRSLIFELKTIVTPVEQPDLERALAVYETVADLGSVKEIMSGDADCLRALRNAARLLEDLQGPRWSRVFHERR